MEVELNYQNSSKNLSKKDNIEDRKVSDNKIIEQLNESEPLFELINQHKKRLLEIKDWKNNFNKSSINNSEITLINNEKNAKDTNSNKKINNFSKEEEKKIENENIENNIKLVKDFLKINSLTKSNIMNTDNNEESTITVNNINYNNIINTTNQNNINDNTSLMLKESPKNDKEKNQSMMNTGINFNSKLALENIKLKNNYNSRTINSLSNRSNMNLIKSLEFKLEKKKIKIKNLESNIELLTKENQNMQKYINELEKKLENIEINKDINLFNQENIIKREQDMLFKINSLSQEILQKNEQIEKMKNLDQIKIKDIQMLNQKCRDLEIISNEIDKEKIEKLLEENKYLKNSINNTDKIMFIINYFVKKIYNIIPSLQKPENFNGIKEPYELQKFFIEIENFMNEYIIYDSNKKSDFFIEYERNKNYNNQYVKNLDKEKEKEELEAKINEINQQNINLLKEIKAKRIISNKLQKNAIDKSKGMKKNKFNFKNKKNTK